METKEGKIDLKFVISGLIFTILMVLFAFGLDVAITAPTNTSINTSTDRNINFTFTPTWDLDSEVMGNCSLWTNFSGTWDMMIEFNGTAETPDHNHTNITNASLSWANYTFTHDLGHFVWDIGCENNSGDSLTWTFNTSNRTLAIDTNAPIVVQTAELYSLFNTSSATPTIKINFTDYNGTGVNIASDGNNSLNITLLDVNGGADTELRKYNASNENLTCIPTGQGIDSSQCTLDISAFPLSNGTKNITIAVTDVAGFTNFTSFTFTVDNTPPVVAYYNFTNTSSFNRSGDDNAAYQLNNSEHGSVVQGATIYGWANWTDNLTQPLQGILQFYNVSAGPAWQTLNTSDNHIYNNLSWTNFSYPIPKDHDVFEGANVSFRIIANDSVGNVNDSMSVKNFTIQINDTTPPTITIPNGTAQVNGTNTSDTAPTISWSIAEGNELVSINVSVDFSTGGGLGVDGSCKKSAFYDTTVGADNVEKHRNGTFTVLTAIEGDVTCPLANGTHNVTIKVIDSWSNTEEIYSKFTIQSGVAPVFVNNSLQSGYGFEGLTNVTPYTGINFSVSDGLQGIKNMSWISTCNSTVQVILDNDPINDSLIWPFNHTNCKAGGANNLAGEANLSVTVTACDFADTCTTETYWFAVDDIVTAVPVIHYPADGFSTYGSFNLSASAFDSMSQIDSIGYYLDGDEGWSNLLNHTIENGRNLTIAQGLNTSILNRTINYTGTHTIKVRVNDTMGNERNSSVITFTQNGPVNMLWANQTIADNNAGNVSNVSFFDTSGALIEGSADTNQTLQLYMELNNTPNEIRANVTINFNGSAANWNLTNEIYVWLNDSVAAGHIINNHTVDVADMVYFNRSFARFLTDNNSYFGMVRMSQNGSLLGGSGYELWYFEDETDVSTRTNITECGTFDLTHSRTSDLPCWNSTSGSNLSVDIFVPHFSAVVKVNDSTIPTVNINRPESTENVGGVIPNITVSSDTVSCTFQPKNVTASTSSASGNTSSAGTVTTVGINKICTWSEIRFKNGAYNITFNATDTAGNVNNSDATFTVSDTTSPNSGIISSSVTGTTTATVTITGVNESVNATAWYSTSNTSFTTSSVTRGTDFATTQSVSLTGLTAETVYYYNVTLYDYNGKSVFNSTVFSFTTDAVAAAAAAASSSSGSSGGGAAAGATSNVQSSKAQVWSIIAAGSSLTMAVNKAQIGITEVSIGNVANELSNVEIKASSLNDNPVSDAAAEKVYQYLQITKKNMKDEDVTGITVKFRVTKTWLSDNGLTQNDVALWRYKDNKWNVLVTTMASSDETYVYYDAETPGFSYFAIGSKVTVAEEVPEEEVTEEVPEEEVQSEVPTPKPIETPSKTSWPGWATFLVIVIAGLILYFVFVKKKKE